MPYQDALKCGVKPLVIFRIEHVDQTSSGTKYAKPFVTKFNVHATFLSTIRNPKFQIRNPNSLYAKTKIAGLTRHQA